MRVFAISPMPPRRALPSIDVLQSCLASGRVLGSRAGSYSAATVGKAPPPSLEFAANTYRLPEMIHCESSWVVSQRVADVLLSHCAAVELLPATMRSAYFVPYEPDGHGHEKYLDLKKSVPFSVIDDAIARNPVDPPDKKYYEVAMHSAGAANGVVFKKRGFDFTEECLVSNILELDLSKEWVKKYKLYSSECIIAEEALFNDLSSFIPYAFSRVIEIEI